MDLLQSAEYAVRLRHRHDDGSVGEFEPVPAHHSPADHDPERAWGNETVYRCTTCDEELLVSATDDPARPPV
jgi:hypothetical protein